MKNMKMKSGFTMIELIFVIVIIGILAAVALPKFVGMASQAHEANLKSFTATLNRTVGPTLWSKAITKDGSGDITHLSASELNLSNYIEIPKEINSTTIDLSKCNSTKYDKVIAVANSKITGVNYDITCRDGDATTAPKFKLWRNLNPGADTIGRVINPDSRHTLISN